MSRAELDLDERVRRAVEQLSGVRRERSLAAALDVGRIVIETLYAGDPSAWRRRARKDHALRTLSQRPELPLSTSALYRALALYELSRRAPASGSSYRHLGASHWRAVLGLPSEAQDRLLSTAEAQRWTVARLEREAHACRAGRRPRGGRRRAAPYVKSIRRILELTSPEALQGLERSSELAPELLGELSAQLAEARARLERLARALPRRSAPASRRLGSRD